MAEHIQKTIGKLPFPGGVGARYSEIVGGGRGEIGGGGRSGNDGGDQEIEPKPRTFIKDRLVLTSFEHQISNLGFFSMKSRFPDQNARILRGVW